MSTRQTPEKGNPASAQPMRGLSQRAQQLLAPRRYGFNTPIEPAGAALARQARVKAAI